MAKEIYLTSKRGLGWSAVTVDVFPPRQPRHRSHQ